MKLSEELAWRGLIKDKTFGNVSWLDKPRKFYLGIDASADSLHVGNLAILLLAQRLLEASWDTVLLAGGATSLIGDPGGKNEERPLQSREVIAKNVEVIKKQISGLFRGQDFTLVDNFDWFSKIGYLEFLRDAGKHYSVSDLIQRDFIAQRLGEEGSGISYAEFSYNLIQGYDFWHLYKNHGAELQIGGSDQWGNLLSGVSLIRKKEGVDVHAFSMPLVIDKSTGRKFGKSEADAVWLDPKKTTPTQFYQFWINIDDKSVENYLKIFTFLGKKEIQEVMTEQKNSPGDRPAQKRLAEEVTKLVHGPEETQTARVVTNVLNGSTGVNEVSEGVIRQVRKEIPTVSLKSNSNIVEALVTTGLAASNSDARRLLASKSVYINNQATDKERFETNDFQNGRLILRRGKAFKDSALVEKI